MTECTREQFLKYVKKMVAESRANGPVARAAERLLQTDELNQFRKERDELLAAGRNTLGLRADRLLLMAERNQLREERDALLARIKSQEWEIAKSRAWRFGTKTSAREIAEIYRYWEDLAKEATKARCAAEPATGWMCARCWKVNAPHASQCTCDAADYLTGAPGFGRRPSGQLAED